MTPSELNRRLGAAIARRREQLLLTPADLAARLKCDGESAVAVIEATPTGLYVGQLHRVAAALGLTLAQLLHLAEGEQ